MNKESTVAALKENGSSKGANEFNHVIKALNTTESPEPSMLLSDKKDPPDKNKSWGFHLLINCSEMDKKINSEKDISKFFDMVINKLGMKKLGPFVHESVDDAEEGRGISAFQMITTSHISMHFDDKYLSGYIDIFSCKPFDASPVVKMVKEYFQPKSVASQLIYRDAGMNKNDSA